MPVWDSSGESRFREVLMTATNDVAMTRRGVLASARAGASAAALGSAPAPAQTGAPKTFVLVQECLARRLVLAARGRSSAKGRVQGVHANDDRVGRALAPHRRQGEPCDPHQRYRQ